MTPPFPMAPVEPPPCRIERTSLGARCRCNRWQFIGRGVGRWKTARREWSLHKLKLRSS